MSENLIAYNQNNNLLDFSIRNKWEIKIVFINFIFLYIIHLMLRFFSSRIPKRDCDKVMIRGTFHACTTPDMPTVIAFPDLLEDPESLMPYFDNKTFRDNRNLWLLSYRNSFGSDRCDTMSPQALADDVMRFMDSKRITTASMFGHGFGAKIASLTGILKYHRVTSVVGVDYSPQDYTNHEAYIELKSAIEGAAALDLTQSAAAIQSAIKELSGNARLNKAIANNLEGSEADGFHWKSGMQELANNMNLMDFNNNIGRWPMVGLFPGRAQFFYAERSNWVHQSSNTIPIYNKFPILLGDYGNNIDHINTDNHWIHETDEIASLSRRIASFYRWYDGVHPTLRHRGEIGKVSLPLRGRFDLDEHEQEWIDEVGDATIPKAIPLHRHHNWFQQDPKVVEETQIPSKN